MQREQLRHSSLGRFEAGWERSAGYLLFSFLSASEDFSADMDSSQPVNSPHNTCSEIARNSDAFSDGRFTCILILPTNGTGPGPALVVESMVTVHQIGATG